MTELPEPGAERIDEQFDGADWDGMDLTGVTFRRCHFLEASMVELRVEFTDTALRSSTLAKAVLCGTSFRSCSLLGTSFAGADVRGMRVSDSDLSYVVLCGVDASKLDLSGARMREIDATDADLRGAAVEAINSDHRRSQRRTNRHGPGACRGDVYGAVIDSPD